MAMNNPYAAYSIYKFINRSLVEVNIEKNPKKKREMIAMTRELRDTWEEALKLLNK